MSAGEDADLIAFSFPGQGAGYGELIRDLTDVNSVGQEEADEANIVIDEVSDAASIDIRKLVKTNDEDELADTRNAQLILLAGGVAGAAYLMNRKGIKPNFNRGHSAAGFTAATVSGAIAVKYAAEALKERGLSMHEAALENPGGMAAVRDIPIDRLDEICHAVGAYIANLNSPVQTIIGGSYDALDKAKREIKRVGGKATIFRNWKAGIAHTPYVKKVQDMLEVKLTPSGVRDADTPVVKNLDGAITNDREEIRHDLTGAASQVHWSQGTETLDKAGVTRHVEIGPKSKKVITGLLKEHVLVNARKIEHISELFH